MFSPRRGISRIMIVLFLMPTDLRIEKASFLTHAEYFSPSGVYVIAHNFISRANRSLLRKRRNNATWIHSVWKMSHFSTKIITKLDYHTVLNLHFLSKNITMIFPRKIVEFVELFCVKTRENAAVLDFLAVDNFDFTRKSFGWKTRENVRDLHFLVVDNFDFLRKL